MDDWEPESCCGCDRLMRKHEWWKLWVRKHGIWRKTLLCRACVRVAQREAIEDVGLESVLLFKPKWRVVEVNWRREGF
jgi:hypothetical protein